MPEGSPQNQNQTPPAAGPADPAGQSATPTNIPADPPAPESTTPGQPVTPPEDGPKLPDASPLADGTAPTVLQTGGTTKATTKVTPKASPSRLNSIYRRADILTTLLTAIGTLAVAGVALGAYLFFTRVDPNANKLPKPTKLEQAEIDKLKAFFEGNNAGVPAEILNITSPSFFKNRAAFASDLRVIGATQVTGPTALGDLTVDKTSTLGVTNVRGQLNVAGPATFQGVTTLTAGASVSGNITVAGNGSFGGVLSAGNINTRDITVNGTLNIAGHIAIAGQQPSVSPASAAGGGTASVDGNDSSGTVIINTGLGITSQAQADGGDLVTITFRQPYPKVPKVVITPVGRSSARLLPYVQRTPNSFTIGAADGINPSTSYAFDYWIAQ